MKYTKYLNLLLLAFWSLNVLAQQPETENKGVQKFSLQDAVSYAKKYNYTLKNNALEVVSAQQKVREILSLGIPNVTAGGSFTNNLVVPSNVINFGGQVTVIKFGNEFSASGNVMATQLLFDGGFLMGVKASKEFVNLSRINLKRTEIETEVGVSKAYYTVLLLKTNIDLLNVNLSTLEKTKGDIEKLYQGGLLEKTEFDRISLQYSSLSLQRDKLKDQHKLAAMVLKVQMGLKPNDEIELTDDLLKMYETSKAVLVEANVDYTKRLEYQLVEQQIRLNNLDKKRYQFGYAPSLTGYITHQENTFGQTFGELSKTWFPGTFWGLNLSVPIFDGFKKSSQIQQAKINISKAENDKKNLESLIDQEVFNAKTTYQRAAEQLEIQKKNMQLAQEIYDRTQIKYKNGVGSSLELTTSQNDLETARTNYLNTLYDYFVAQLDLRKATGNIK